MPPAQTYHSTEGISGASETTPAPPSDHIPLLAALCFLCPALAGLFPFPSGPAVAWAIILKHDQEKPAQPLMQDV
jgi:hypothetical protein